MDEDGMYTHSTLQDYPSVLQLNNKMRENAINIIFAVTEPQQEAYKILMKIIDGAKVGLLTADSSNILELVEELYKVYSGSEFAHYDFLWTPHIRPCLPLIVDFFYMLLGTSHS